METIYFKGIPLECEVEPAFLKQMELNGWIKKEKGKNTIAYNREYKFYFSLPTKKAAAYLTEVLKSKAICSLCGAENSIHISPKIEGDVVNFKEIICVCFGCRGNKLKKKDILIPQFAKEVTSDTLFADARKDILSKFSSQDSRLLFANSEYIKLKMKEANLRTYLKVMLPPLNHTQSGLEIPYLNDLLVKYGISSLHEELDLDSFEERRKARNILYDENKGFCSCCGHKKRFKEFTIDHIIAKENGGKNIVQNLIGLCYDCNQKKGSKRIMEVLRKKRYNRLPYRILRIAYDDKVLIEQELHKLSEEIIEKEAVILLS